MDEARTPDPFGTGLATADGDLAFTDGDLRTVRGEENLVQGLSTMILTPFTSDLFNVAYGFDLANVVLKPHSRPLVKELIRLNVVKSLSLDSRVQEVREVVFDDSARFFELLPTADPEQAQERHRTERRWRAAVVLATVTQDELVIELEGPGL